MIYRVGTRGSRLAVAQTEMVLGLLRMRSPGSRFETTIMETRGDRDPRPLFMIDQKGVFEREIDSAVLDGRVDFAVHSLKDLPSSLPVGLVLACVPERGPISDVVIPGGGPVLDHIRYGGTIGTSSLRRAVQIRRCRPDLRVVPIRGNVDTRVHKVGRDGYDAVVLARAGLERLHHQTGYTDLPVSEFLPSPGQGALGVVARSDDQNTIAMLKKVEDWRSRAEAVAERALSQRIESGCRFPVGAYASADEDTLAIRAAAFSMDGTRHIAIQKSGRIDDPAGLGRVAGEEMLNMGAGDLADGWRDGLEEWNRC